MKAEQVSSDGKRPSDIALEAELERVLGEELSAISSAMLPPSSSSSSSFFPFPLAPEREMEDKERARLGRSTLLDEYVAMRSVAAALGAMVARKKKRKADWKKKQRNGGKGGGIVGVW